MGTAARALTAAAMVFLAGLGAWWLLPSPVHLVGPRTPPEALRPLAAGCAALLAAWAAVRPRRALWLLPCAAAGLVVARAPAPPAPPPAGEARPVALEGRLLRWQALPRGRAWLLLDRLQARGGVGAVVPGERLAVVTSQLPARPPALGSRLAVAGSLQVRDGRLRLDEARWRRLPPPPDIGVLHRLREAVRDRLRARLSPPSAGLAIALLLGESRAAPGSQRSAYRVLGLLHLLTVSGLHFWVWSWLLHRLLPRRLRVLRPWLLLLLAALAAFSAPVVRAGCALLLREWLARRGRQGAALALWAAALWVELAAVRPGPGGLSLLLSYAATAALICVRCPPGAGRAARVLLPSAAAWLATTPFLHAIQGTVEVWGIPFTPALAPLLPLRLLASACALLPGLPPLADGALRGLDTLEAALLQFAERLPGTPAAATAWPPALVALLCAAGLALLLLRAPAARFGVAAAAGVLLLVGPPQAPPRCTLLPGPAGPDLLLTGPRGSVLVGHEGLRGSSGRWRVDRSLMPALTRLHARRPWSGLDAQGRAWARGRLPQLEARLGPPQPLFAAGPTRHGDWALRTWRAGAHAPATAVDVSGAPGRVLCLLASDEAAWRALVRQAPPGPVRLLVVPLDGRTPPGLTTLLDHFRPHEVWLSRAPGMPPPACLRLLRDRGVSVRVAADAPLSIGPPGARASRGVTTEPGPRHPGMQAATFGACLHSGRAQLVRVECLVDRGLPRVQLVGMADLAAREARERLPAAFAHQGLHFPRSRVLFNLAPAQLPKRGLPLDAALAAALLCASKQVPAPARPWVLVAELDLAGRLRPPARGTLLAAAAAAQAPGSCLVTAPAAASEAALATGLEVAAPADLAGLVAILRGEPSPATTPGAAAPATSAAPGHAVPGRTAPDHAAPTPSAASAAARAAPAGPALCLDAVRGQAAACEAAVLAVAGRHSLLLQGPPGTGKSMLARCLPALLPPPSPERALELAQLEALHGPVRALPHDAPFRAPHHTVSAQALLGGGRPLRPGELSRAHGGVLFLDELPEFPRPALEGLRQPLEEGEVRIDRAGESARFPAEVLLVAARNPCPCGFATHPVKPCTCTPSTLARYARRTSGPLLDRFDLFAEMGPVPAEVLQGPPTAPTQADARAWLARARTVQADRQRAHGWGPSAQATREQLFAAGLRPAARRALQRAADALHWSGRAHLRCLRVARTVADTRAAEAVDEEHVLAAIAFRPPHARDAQPDLPAVPRG